MTHKIVSTRLADYAGAWFNNDYVATCSCGWVGLSLNHETHVRRETNDWNYDPMFGAAS